MRVTRQLLRLLEPDERVPLLRADVRRRVAAALGVADKSLRADVPLAAMGLDSLAAVELQHGLQRDLEVESSTHGL